MARTQVTRNCAHCGTGFIDTHRDKTRRFCSHRCDTLHRYPHFYERLFQNIAESHNPAMCWPWTGPRSTTGYGRIRSDNRGLQAHRVVWEYFNGPIPDGLCALHRCDNRPCCNPHHLFLGTEADNTHDAMAKGRLSHGEHRYNAKLTAERVREIRSAIGTQDVIAAQFGISRANVSLIRSRKHWRHVD